MGGQAAVAVHGGGDSGARVRRAQHLKRPPRVGGRDPLGQQPHAGHRVGQAEEVEPRIAGQLAAGIPDAGRADPLTLRARRNPVIRWPASGW